jgi:hypothetical protein
VESARAGFGGLVARTKLRLGRSFHHLVQDVGDGQRGWFWRFYRPAQALGNPVRRRASIDRAWIEEKGGCRRDVREEISGAGGFFGLKVLVWAWISSEYVVRRGGGGGGGGGGARVV